MESLRVIYNITEELDISDSGPIDNKVRKIVFHSDFYSGGLYNDIALLILENAVELNGLVNSVCLPEQGMVFNSTNCWAAGWGVTNPRDSTGEFRIILLWMLKFYCRNSSLFTKSKSTNGQTHSMPNSLTKDPSRI